jgi:hypothetical protein
VLTSESRGYAALAVNVLTQDFSLTWLDASQIDDLSSHEMKIACWWHTETA